MIKDFFDTTFTVKRSTWTTDGSGNPYSTESSEGNFKGHVQQADPELVEQLALSITKTFAVWCPHGTDVTEGDTITDGTNTYSVRAVMDYGVGSNKHYELIVEKDDV